MNDASKYYLVITIKGDGLGDPGQSVHGPFDTLEEPRTTASEIAMREQSYLMKRKVDLAKPPTATFEVVQVVSTESFSLKLSLEHNKSDAV